jgi:hypothetical protein
MKAAICILAVILSILLASCASVGQFMPLSPDETVIGTIQTSFLARGSWFKKEETSNMQAYIKLLEAAVQKYPGNIDIRDVLWATGRIVNNIDVEVSATGKVIALDPDEK